MSSFTKLSVVLLSFLAASRTVNADLACGAGQIGLGTSFVHLTVHAEAAIFDSSCSSVDFKSGGTDDNICGAYSGGADVTCDASGHPRSVVLANGTSFGNCVLNVHDCDNIKKVQFCCSPL